MKKEIKDDIKYVKKNLFLGFKYFLHLSLYYGIVAIGLLILAYYLSAHVALSTGSIIIFLLIYLFLGIFFNIYYFRAKFRNICKEECSATIVHSITLSNRDNLVWDISHRYIYLIKYQYKKRNHTRMVEIWDDDKISIKNKKINIKICKYFPKLIYIEKKHKNEEND